MDITFKNLTYSVQLKNEEKFLLKGIEGICKSGEVTAILGMLTLKFKTIY